MASKENTECGSNCWMKQIPTRSLERSNTLPDREKMISSADSEKLCRISKQLYSPLLPWQTRLLCIQPGSGTDELECKLDIADLVVFPGLGLVENSKLVEYEALSYSWGYPNFESIILCNQVEMPITKSLFEAIHQLRLPDEDRYLWTDAICINQADNKEKAMHIRNMFVIFQKAVRVVAWLGIPKENDIPILEILNQWGLYTDDQISKSIEHDEECIQYLNKLVESLAQLMNRPWFGRTWVRQEVYANSKVVLAYGNSRASFDTFWMGLERLRQLVGSQPYLTSLLELDHMSCLVMMRRSRAKPGKFITKKAPEAPIAAGLWLSGLLTSSYFKCTDPKDKVYGVLGMLHEQSGLWLNAYTGNPGAKSLSFPINYEKSISEVYQDTIKYLIDRDRNLLCLCAFQDRTALDFDLPKWIINLNQDIPRWYLASHWPQADLSRIPKSRADLKRLDLFSMHEWPSFQGRFEAEQTDMEDINHLQVRGSVIAQVRRQIMDEEDWSKVKIGGHLDRLPPHPESKYVMKNGKLVIQSSENSAATIGKLIQECCYRIWELELPAEWANVTGYSELSLNILGSSILKEGDMMAILNGSEIPFIVRSNNSKTGQYQFLGPALWLTAPEKASGTPGDQIRSKSHQILHRSKQQYEKYCSILDATGSSSEVMILV